MIPLFKCKLVDLCEDILTLGVTEITMSDCGLNIAVVEHLKCKGVKVNVLKGRRL